MVPSGRPQYNYKTMNEFYQEPESLKRMLNLREECSLNQQLDFSQGRIKKRM
jgi:hypothetical protein